VWLQADNYPCTGKFSEVNRSNGYPDRMIFQSIFNDDRDILQPIWGKHLLPPAYRVAGLLKRWLSGAYHGAARDYHLDY